MLTSLLPKPFQFHCHKQKVECLLTLCHLCGDLPKEQLRHRSNPKLKATLKTNMLVVPIILLCVGKSVFILQCGYITSSANPTVQMTNIFLVTPIQRFTNSMNNGKLTYQNANSIGRSNHWSWNPFKKRNTDALDKSSINIIARGIFLKK